MENAKKSNTSKQRDRNTIQQQKRMNYGYAWYLLFDPADESQTLCWVKESRHKGRHIMAFYIEDSRKHKLNLKWQKADQEFPRDKGGGNYLEWDTRELFGVTEVLHVLIVVMVIQGYKLTKLIEMYS